MMVVSNFLWNDTFGGESLAKFGGQDDPRLGCIMPIWVAAGGRSWQSRKTEEVGLLRSPAPRRGRGLFVTKTANTSCSAAFTAISGARTKARSRKTTASSFMSSTVPLVCEAVEAVIELPAPLAAGYAPYPMGPGRPGSTRTSNSSTNTLKDYFHDQDDSQDGFSGSWSNSRTVTESKFLVRILRVSSEPCLRKERSRGTSQLGAIHHPRGS
ncbi:unnamed protein product [Amoebophrya sp. A25]|nr:unnamed protein product [Amoebophrya sp. A25]|eukprot:GSA25T00016697001.1